MPIMRFNRIWPSVMLAAAFSPAVYAAEHGIHYQLVATSTEFPAKFGVAFDWPSFISEDIALTPPALKSCGFSGLYDPCSYGGLYFDSQSSWLQGPAGLAGIISFMDAPGFGGVLLFVPQHSLSTLGSHAGFSYYKDSTVTMTVSLVPEPDVVTMFAAGLIVFGWRRCHRHNAEFKPAMIKDACSHRSFVGATG